LKRFFIVLERIAFAVIVVLVSILVPDFGSMMAFLGSFSAFMLCVIYPVCSKIALEKRVGLWDVILLVMAIVMAAWGTGAAFLSP
jgi:solute carrier family 32 (vesicular inhibitory amino acid transporter)